MKTTYKRGRIFAVICVILLVKLELSKRGEDCCYLSLGNSRKIILGGLLLVDPSLLNQVVSSSDKEMLSEEYAHSHQKLTSNILLINVPPALK